MCALFIVLCEIRVGSLSVPNPHVKGILPYSGDFNFKPHPLQWHSLVSPSHDDFLREKRYLRTHAKILPNCSV
jgi:hypothetical protein